MFSQSEFTDIILKAYLMYAALFYGTFPWGISRIPMLFVW